MSAAGPVFTRRDGSEGLQRYARWADTRLPDGATLRVTTVAGSKAIEVGLMGDRSSLDFKVSAPEARALANELLACADAAQAAGVDTGGPRA